MHVLFFSSDKHFGSKSFIIYYKEESKHLYISEFSKTMTD